MLLGAGGIVRRHATSELRRHPRPALNLLRSFSSSVQFDAPKLPHLLPGHFKPREDPNPAAKEIAVLGGGITGLTTAYNLARSIPHANITIYEKSERLGGWIDSEVVPVTGGEVVFEWGPRSLRPSLEGAGWATANLISTFVTLQQPDSAILAPSKSSVVATNRFLYYPDHLVRMPSGYGNPITNTFHLFSLLWSEPLFQGILPGLMNDIRSKHRSLSVRDESVGDFLSRRFSPELADNIASAVMHGIYAGDIYNLSARTLLPHLWFLETRDPDSSSLIMESLDLFIKGKRSQAYEDVKFRNMNPPDESIGASTSFVMRAFQNASIITWSEGMGYMVRKLTEKLGKETRVTMKTGSGVESLSFDKGRQKVMVGDSPFDYAVSTLSPATMKAIIRPSEKPLSVDTFKDVSKSVSVMVVNLWYKEEVLSAQQEGFGYLIPRSVPLEENPERALGVVFAHNMSGESRTIFERKRGDTEMEMKLLDEWVKKYKAKLKADAAEIEEGLRGHPEELKDKRIIWDHYERLRKSMEAEVNASQHVLDEFEANKDKIPEVTYIKTGQDTAEGSKLAVMLGGHWWNGWQESDYPTEEEGIAMAKSILRRHLNITVEPEVAKARLQKDCIPQYPVGYRDYMAKIHNRVLMPGFEGRLKVAGPWYQGAVGVNDCIRRASQVAMDIREGWDQNTGLEHYCEEEKWLLKDRETGMVQADPLSG